MASSVQFGSGHRVGAVEPPATVVVFMAGKRLRTHIDQLLANGVSIAREDVRIL